MDQDGKRAFSQKTTKLQGGAMLYNLSINWGNLLDKTTKLEPHLRIPKKALSACRSDQERLLLLKIYDDLDEGKTRARRYYRKFFDWNQGRLNRFLERIGIDLDPEIRSKYCLGYVEKSTPPETPLGTPPETPFNDNRANDLTCKGFHPEPHLEPHPEPLSSHTIQTTYKTKEKNKQKKKVQRRRKLTIGKDGHKFPLNFEDEKEVRRFGDPEQLREFDETLRRLPPRIGMETQNTPAAWVHFLNLDESDRAKVIQALQNYDFQVRRAKTRNEYIKMASNFIFKGSWREFCASENTNTPQREETQIERISRLQSEYRAFKEMRC